MTHEGYTYLSGVSRRGYMGRANIKLPRDVYERHKENRNELGVTWAEYIDHQAPEYTLTEKIETVSQDEIREIVREEVRDALREVAR